MRYIWQHITAIINAYTGGIPLAHFLKNYFKQYAKLGSRDRKILSELAYSWYRCSKGFDATIPFEDKLQACLLLCSTQAPYALRLLPENWRLLAEAPLEERMIFLAQHGNVFSIEQTFPFDIELSAGISRTDWLNSMLVQPRLFIRVRKQCDQLEQLLRQQQIPFTVIDEHCLSLPNGAPIDKILPEDSYVVQDASSQQTGNWFVPKPNEQWYDCCSGAGGKSLLLKDLEPNVQLTVSDKRQSILHNLKQRFKQYHHSVPQAFAIDVSDKQQLHQLGNQQFDAVICDVPCSGAGTWARTPEQLYYFDPPVLDTLAPLQQTIAINAAQRLKPRGRLLYITCSVFERENEAVVHNVASLTGLAVQHMCIINGIGQQADSMFIAVLKKSTA